MYIYVYVYTHYEVRKVLKGNGGVKIQIKANVNGNGGSKTIKIEGNWTASEISAVIEKINEVLKIEKAGGSR